MRQAFNSFVLSIGVNMVVNALGLKLGLEGVLGIAAISVVVVDMWIAEEW